MGSGQGFVTITRNLHQAGIVRHPRKFRLLARIRGSDRQIKAGEYLLPASMTPNRLLDVLVEGKVRLYRLTIPEGYTLRQIAQVVESAGFAAASEFLKAAQDPDAVRQAGIEAATFEGYLFPDTYYFPKGQPPGPSSPRWSVVFESVFKTAVGGPGQTSGIFDPRDRYLGVDYRKGDRRSRRAAGHQFRFSQPVEKKDAA